MGTVFCHIAPIVFCAIDLRAKRTHIPPPFFCTTYFRRLVRFEKWYIVIEAFKETRITQVFSLARIKSRFFLVRQLSNKYLLSLLCFHFQFSKNTNNFSYIDISCHPSFSVFLNISLKYIFSLLVVNNFYNYV